MGPQPKPDKVPLEKESFREQLKPLGKMPTIEHFFNFYVHMKRPTEMPREIDLHFFRDDLVPMWEVSDHTFSLKLCWSRTPLRAALSS